MNFVESPAIVTLAHVASEFGGRPSDYFTGLPEVARVQIDVAAAVRLWQERNRMYEEHQLNEGPMVYL